MLKLKRMRKRETESRERRSESRPVLMMMILMAVSVNGGGARLSSIIYLHWCWLLVPYVVRIDAERASLSRRTFYLGARFRRAPKLQ